MKKSIITKGALTLMLVGFAWACSDSFLDKKPLGVYDQQSLSNSAGVNASLIATYHMLSGYNIDNSNTWASNPVNWIFGSIDTDDAYKGSESTDDPGGLTQTETYNWSAGMINLSDKWIPTYEGVRRSNATLNLLATAKDISSDDAKRIKGEAMFLRAWYHFELFKVFTNVPYFRETDTDLKKSNVGVDVVGECIKDMLEVVDALPVKQNDIGRVNKVAAQAFLGKLYMYQAGYNNDDKAAFSKAKEQFDKVLAVRNQTSLNPCFKDVFTMTGENSAESLFSVQANINDNNQARNADWLNQLAYPVGPAGSFGCCGFHQPSQNLVNAFKTDAGTGLPLSIVAPSTWNDADAIPDKTVPVDPRLDLTVGRDNVPYLDWGIHQPSWIRSRSYSGPYSPKKYMQFKSDPASNGGWNANATSAVNVQLIRLSDVMLMAAECEAQVGSLSKARDLVNYVRTRAGNCGQGLNIDPASGAAITGASTITTDFGSVGSFATYVVKPYPASGYFDNTAQALKAIRTERRLELALEGHRFFDLKRYGFSTAQQVLNDFTAKEKTRRPYYSGAAQFEEKHMSFPIPSNQVQLGLEGGKPTLVQNPGW